MLAEFSGKVALVTGGASGIGRAAAVAFAQAGAQVVVADIDEAGGAETVTLIQDAGGIAVFVHCDVSDESSVRALLASVHTQFGGLHAAFNNAGTEGVSAEVHAVMSSLWQRTLDINLTGAMLCMKYEVPLMLESGGGAIVNCASILGLVGMPATAAYTTSKHGMIGLTKATAIELAPKGIRVNAICPGFIETPMLERAGVIASDEAKRAAEALHPMNRLGRAEEVASAAVWLCSAGASFITGVALPVDGGFVAR